MQNLSRQLKFFKKEVQSRVNTYKIKLAQLIIFELIYSTPVDTSTALSNWLAQLSKPNSNKIKAHKFGANGSTKSFSAHTAYMLGNTIIRQAKIGEVIYITNNIDYIQLLNRGYSKQAEKGYIEDCVERAITMAKRVKL